MPASLKRINVPGGASVLLHVCEVCGAEASFGVGVEFRQALIRLAGGDVVTAKRLLGKWYCGEHRPTGGDARG
ncbi:hypothetical protein R5W24_000502 [Gemmata sp. JC717]|uniref:hypothetical protein n=1 Tax=Gemmata algarum TaxID=2975278 RepID=UPI0021BA8EA7|nr:hypothetical protein [Gemmata algarum]MDY3551426.1 hypothetical protein [Gemmata algarum]